MNTKAAFPHPSWIGAQYRQPPLAEYCGNPLIEALPPINAPEDIASVLHVRPEFNSCELGLPAHIRTHCVKRLKDWVELRPIYFDVEQILSMLLRQGYLARNPLKATTMRMLYALGRRDPSELSTRVRQSNVASAFVLEGLSGVGKSTLLETLLALYPQVIEHTRYQKAPFLQKQITYLIVPCPSEASPRALCLEFFKAVDDILGTSYYAQYSKSRHGSDTLLIEMALVATTFHVGVLVVDEIQNLKAARSAIRALARTGGKAVRPTLSPKAKELMNFFVKLINWIGVPTIFVGTGDVMPLFDETMQYVRRSTAAGHVVVKSVPRASEEWHSLLAKLWRYQWLRSSLPFNLKACKVAGSREAEISARCHYLSCGIPDVLVKLFMQGQWLALRSHRETLDIPLLDEAYDAQLAALHPSLEALRAGDDGASDEYESCYPDRQTMEALSIPPASHVSTCWPETSPVAGAGSQGKMKSAVIARNAPVADLTPQFKVSIPQEMHELDQFNLRTVSASGNAMQKIRESGIVFDLRKLI